MHACIHTHTSYKHKDIFVNSGFSSYSCKFGRDSLQLIDDEEDKKINDYPGAADKIFHKFNITH